uniref:Uncharacterized protein n=1 Tax=Arundo donax TaxID=35708 RepID=A0A0A9BFG7_ARUDO
MTSIFTVSIFFQSKRIKLVTSFLVARTTLNFILHKIINHTNILLPCLNLLLLIWLICKNNKILLQILIRRLNSRQIAPIKQLRDIRVDSLLDPPHRLRNLPGTDRSMTQVVSLDVYGEAGPRGAAAVEEYCGGAAATGGGEGGAELAEVGEVVVPVVGEA